MTNVQERGAAAKIALQTPARFGAQQAAPGTSRSPVLMTRDAIRRIGPPSSAGGLFNAPWGSQASLGGIVSQLLDVIQQLVSMLSGTSLFGSMFGGSQPAPQTFYQHATGSSTGDPHLGFSGTDGNGRTQSARFDSMTGHGDLLDSDSFPGGYQLSTSVTQPGANGVTYNQEATISTGFGQTQVSLDRNGNARILQNGETISLANGQSVDLGGGETVTRNADGSVVVRDENALGGSIATTLSRNGEGVDVNTQASNVDLGGDLLNQPPQMRPMQTIGVA